MKALKQAIEDKGLIKTNEILDVSQFLNGIVDAKLMSEIGEDFAQRFKDEDFDIFITVESSGIAPSVFASLYANKPLVVIKKYADLLDDTFVQQPSFSFTKKQDYYLTSKKALLENKRVILIDDFLAAGSVVENVHALLDKCNSELVGVGICITKGFQNGYKMLSEKGYNLYSQVTLASMSVEDQTIEYLY